MMDYWFQMKTSKSMESQMVVNYSIISSILAATIQIVYYLELSLSSKGVNSLFIPFSAKIILYLFITTLRSE